MPFSQTEHTVTGFSSIARCLLLAMASSVFFGLAIHASTSGSEIRAHAESLTGQKSSVILILTDYQVYADLGRHGNAILKTP